MEWTQRIFSCSNCEVHLEASDYKHLGLRMAYLQKNEPGRKRFKSLGMDGKVIGSLRDYPVQSGDLNSLKSAKGVTSKVMNNRLSRSELKHLTQAMRKFMRTI